MKTTAIPITEKTIIATANIFQSISSPLFTPDSREDPFLDRIDDGREECPFTGVYLCHEPADRDNQGSENHKKEDQLDPVRHPQTEDERRGGILQCGRWHYGDAMCAQIVQGEVEFQNVYAGFTEKTELFILGLLCDECRDITFGQVPLAGNAGNLVIRCSDADIRIEAASRGGDKVDRDRLGIGRIGGMEGIDPCIYLVDEGRVGGAEVRAGRYR